MLHYLGNQMAVLLFNVFVLVIELNFSGFFSFRFGLGLVEGSFLLFWIRGAGNF